MSYDLGNVILLWFFKKYSTDTSNICNMNDKTLILYKSPKFLDPG